MPGNIETELKLKILPPVGCTDVWQVIANAAVLRQLAVDWAETDMEAWYYDTDEYNLQQSGLAYRVRREGDVWVATVKTNGSTAVGLHQRQEWNLSSPGKEPQPGLFTGLPVGQALRAAIGGRPLQPLFVTAFKRKSTEVVYGEACIELAVDEGRIIAGELAEPICELELELKSGDPLALLQLGAAIAADVTLVPEPKSKYYRAILLAGITEVQTKAANEPLEPPLVAIGLPALFSVAVGKVFTAYEAFVISPEDPRAIHRLRVKLRRLRALLQFARPCIQAEQFAVWKQTLVKLSDAFGLLRDIDVLAAEWNRLCDNPYISFDSKPWLGENISIKRAELLEQTQQNIEQLNFCGELLKFWAWILSDPWQQGDYPVVLANYARWRIGAWLATLLDMGKTADWQSEQQLHEMRLQLKKIRYTLAAAPPNRRMEKLILQVKNMQTLFGAINDHATTGRTLKAFTRGATRAVYRDIGLLSGWQAKDEEFVRGQLKAQWKEFRQSARRWLED